MGYLIQYNPEDNRKYPSNSIRNGKRIWRYMLASLVVAVALILAAKYKDTLLRWILPGESAVTAAAMQHLANDLRDGATAADAITAFCKEIISHAAD